MPVDNAHIRVLADLHFLCDISHYLSQLNLLNIIPYNPLQDVARPPRVSF